jgi:outer membrane protein assembly factor BamB
MRRAVVAIALLGLCVPARSLAADPPAFGTALGGPTAHVNLPTDHSGGTPDEVWRSEFVGLGVRAEKPLADGGRIFAFEHQENSKASVIALDIGDGHTLWRTVMDDSDDQAAPAVGDGIVAYDNPTNIRALAQATGALAWTVPDIDAQRLVVADGSVYATATAAGIKGLYAFDAATGAPRWSVPIADLALDVQPVVTGGVVAIYRATGAFQGFSTATGASVWTAPPQSSSDARLPRLLADDGVVFGHDLDCGLTAVVAATGVVLWSSATACSDLAGADDLNVYAGFFGKPSPLLAYDRTTGALRWARDSTYRGNVTREGPHVYSGFAKLDPATGNGVPGFANSIPAFRAYESIYGDTTFALVEQNGSPAAKRVYAYRDVTAPSVAITDPKAATNTRRPQIAWFAEDASSGIDHFDILADGQPLASGVAGGSRVYTPGSDLPEGSHDLEVRATDVAGNTGVDHQTVIVDVTAPDAPQLGVPPADARDRGRDLLFTWSRPADSGGSGIAGYDLYIDGEPRQNFDCGGPDCTHQDVYPLSRGSHEWFVRVRDGAGNETQSETRSFSVNSPPEVTLTPSDNPALTGREITFTATAAAPGFPEATDTYAFDLDGDGSYEVEPSATSTAARTYSSPGIVPVSVRVTDDFGSVVTASVDLDVRPAPGDGQVGFTINGGARFTNDREVTLSPVWPALADGLLIANDGGFGDPTSLPVGATVPWTLDSSGAERLPRIVYLRFRSGPYDLNTQTFTDDIILDETAPRIVGLRARKAGRHRYRLTVRASDRTSGVSSLKLGSKKYAKFRRHPVVKTRAKTLPVRVRDRAGNASKVRRAKLR